MRKPVDHWPAADGGRRSESSYGSGVRSPVREFEQRSAAKTMRPGGPSMLLQLNPCKQRNWT